MSQMYPAKAEHTNLTNTSYFSFPGLYDPNTGQLLHRLMASYINSSFSGMSTDPWYLLVVVTKMPGLSYGLKSVSIHNFGEWEKDQCKICGIIQLAIS